MMNSSYMDNLGLSLGAQVIVKDSPGWAKGGNWIGELHTVYVEHGRAMGIVGDAENHDFECPLHLLMPCADGS